MDSSLASGSSGSGDAGSAAKAGSSGVEREKGKMKAPRVVRACDACRKKKIRCLGAGLNDEPCSHCKAAGVPCLFEERATKRGPPKGYVESLERRLEAMEALLRHLPGGGDNLGIDGSLLSGEEESPQSATTVSPGSNSPPVPGRGQVNIDTLTLDMEELSVDKDRYVGRGSGLHLARSIREFSNTDANTNIAEDAVPSLVEILLQQEHIKKSHLFPIPPADLSAKLVDAYFDSTNKLAGLLHRPSFDRAMASGLLDTDMSFRSLYFMVCAIGARFVEDDRMPPPLMEEHPAGAKQSRGYQFYRASTGSASPHLVCATLFDIQCAVLTVIWLMGCSSPISAWASVGYAVRRAVDVGVHREKRARWTASPLEDQLRKRAFSMLCGMDRYISSGLGRPLAIQDSDIDLQPPLDIDDAALDEWNVRKASDPSASTPGLAIDPTSISGANSWDRLQYIMGRTMSILYGLNRSLDAQKATAAVCELDGLLSQWLNDVPDHLRWNPNEQNPVWFQQSCALYTNYYCCQILVHRDFLSPKRANLHPFPSLAICGNAARSCSHILDTLRERGFLLSAFWYAPLCAVQAGLILLINVFQAGQMERRLSSSALSDVKKCIRVLGVLSDSTFIASKCVNGLTKLASLATAPPPDTTANRDPSAPTLKRPSPEDWMDGESPNSSSLDSSGPSPVDSGALADDAQGNTYKNSRGRISGPDWQSSRSGLPLTREDLSLPTFNGRLTFKSNGATGQPVDLRLNESVINGQPNRQAELNSNPMLNTWPRDDEEAHAALLVALGSTAPTPLSPFDYLVSDKVVSPAPPSTELEADPALASENAFGTFGYQFSALDFGMPMSDFGSWENAFGDTLGANFASDNLSNPLGGPKPDDFGFQYGTGQSNAFGLRAGVM